MIPGTRLGVYEIAAQIGVGGMGEVYRVGGADGRAEAHPYIAMEPVEGDDLSQRIAKGAIPIDEALPIAKQIAEAFEAGGTRSSRASSCWRPWTKAWRDRARGPGHCLLPITGSVGFQPAKGHETHSDGRVPVSTTSKSRRSGAPA